MSQSGQQIKIKNSAPGQYLGYSLQQVRLCNHLLRVPNGTSVSLELYDDVAIHEEGNSLTLEQSKSALSGNPISNGSEEFWKTMANWADLCTNGQISVSSTRFIIYVTPAKTGSIAVKLHQVIDKEAAEAALLEIKKLQKNNSLTGCAAHLARFLAAGDDVCTQIIIRFQLVSENDPMECIRSQLRIVSTEALDGLCAAAIGLARDRADKLIREKQPAIIDAEQYRIELRAFVRKHYFANILLSKTEKPTDDQISALVDTAPMFVQQLQAISAESDMLVTAVSDYLRSTADKIHWADEGTVYKDSFDELDAQLVRQHNIFRNEVEDMNASLDEPRRGRVLYRKCIATKMPLEGRTLPEYFIAGAFNCLADDCKIGWHPNYLALFPAE